MMWNLAIMLMFSVEVLPGANIIAFLGALTQIDVDVSQNPRNCWKKGYFERSCCKPFVRRAALT
jgi:hypothetical protein